MLTVYKQKINYIIGRESIIIELIYLESIISLSCIKNIS